MSFTLAPLQYAPDALEPHVSEDSVLNHYEHHSQHYFDVVNKLVKGTMYEKSSHIEDLISKDTMIQLDTKLFTSACQAWNHDFYWACMTPASKSTKPSDALMEKIEDAFESFDKFKAKFTDRAVAHLGSGWAWLVMTDIDLLIKTTPNAGTPLTTPHHIPLLTCDVWEHAYLYDSNYVADREAYVKAWWNVVNWDFVNSNFEKATK